MRQEIEHIIKNQILSSLQFFSAVFYSFHCIGLIHILSDFSLSIPSNVWCMRAVLRETEEELHRWRDVPCLWVRRLTILKMSVLPKFNDRFNKIQTKIPSGYFIEIDNLILKVTWKCKGLRIAKLKKRIKLKGEHSLISRLILKTQ